MRNRWAILAVLFAIRCAIAFQFQSVAAVAPLLTSSFGVDIAGVGFLIGLYFAPGLALALPGGAIGRRFGDKSVVLAGLALMLAGSLIAILSASWTGQLAGRLVAGVGGVLLNVQMTKMVADWFVGREIATAMAVFVNSWPVGIALSLLLLPLVGQAAGINAVHLTVMALIAGGVLLAAAYQAPPQADAGHVASARLDRADLIGVIIAGSIWTLFNVGFAMVFSFGPSMLVERGWSLPEAGAAISTVLWVAAISVPLGGLLADRSQRPELILVIGCVVSGLLLFAITRSGAVIPIVLLLGIMSGLPAGSIMSLPARLLGPATRSIGMGVFYTVFYLGMMLGPTVGGGYSKSAGTAAAAFDFGAVVVLLCPILLWMLYRVVPALHRPTPAT